MSADIVDKLMAVSRFLEKQDRDSAAAWVQEGGAEIERLRYALDEIIQWANAYPLEVFPEPDLAKASALLEAGGLTLGAVSASNMRHVITQVAAIAKRARGATP
jgi:hypothetical protein